MQLLCYVLWAKITPLTNVAIKAGSGGTFSPADGAILRNAIDDDDDGLRQLQRAEDLSCINWPVEKVIRGCLPTVVLEVHE